MTATTPDPDHTHTRDTSQGPPELFELPTTPELFNPKAPHETAGALRAHRAGLSGPKIAALLGSRGTSLMNELQRGLDQEGQASRAGLEIHDAGIDRQAAAKYLEEAESA